jgi:nucleotide-binding universal stress UspA family protein
MNTSKIVKVLIALDYDPTAQTVAEIGFSMAKAMNAEVILLHVIADTVYYSSTAYSPIMGFTGQMEMEQIQWDSVDTLKKVTSHYLNNAREHLGDEAIKTIVTEGDFADAIIKAAKDNDADILVMGSHSRKWLEKIILGSVTEKVLKITTLPLFIIPIGKHN